MDTKDKPFEPCPWIKEQKIHDNEKVKITREVEYCMGGGAYDTDGIWKPTKEELWMRHCIKVLNKIYGNGFIKYE